ncbi:MAG TPA: tetratricopeptide repeat protein [Bryocella sp.]|nr:tetratricopeptide repeat protein [Bryocella sp.]
MDEVIEQHAPRPAEPGDPFVAGASPVRAPALGIRRLLAPAVLLLLIAAALYAPVQTHPFANFDDDVYILVNDHVKSGLNWNTVRWAFTTYYAANWHPLTWLSHAADYQMFGGHPAGHHDMNLLLHAVNAALLFWVLATATGYLGRSWMVAALFAVHPVNVETVAWVAERKNLLSMTFFLLALAAYRWYALTPRDEAQLRARRRRYLAVTLLFALALMAKPQVVTFPFVLLLWDYWPLRRTAFRSSFRSSLFGFLRNGSSATSGETQMANGEQRPTGLRFLLLEKIPFLLMSAASVLLTVAAQRDGGGFNPEYNLLTRVENSLVAYVRYIGKGLWPSHLAPMYPHPGTSLPAWQAALALMLLAVITALVVRARERRYLLVGWLWFLGTLVPMIGIVQVGRQALADRYAYLSFVGLFIMVCWGIADLAERRRIASAWLAAPSCVVLVALAFVTHRQIGYWRDNITLWRHTAAVTSNNYQAEVNLGESLQKAGQNDEAHSHFLRAVEINPKFPPAIMFLAVRDQRDGDVQAALDKYQQVIRLTDFAPHQNAAIRALAFGNMGHAYREMGELQAARSSLQSAVALKQDNFQVWMDLGLVLQRTGDPARAAQAYAEAVRLQPSDLANLLLSRALDQSGQKPQAEQALRRAKLLTNNYQRLQQVADSLLGPRS